MNRCTKKNCPMNAETLNPDCNLKSCPYRTEISEDLISREEAINVVHKYFVNYLKLNDDICLDGLRSLPSVTPTISKMEQVEDCISREETLNKINGLITEYIPLMPTGWTLPLNIAKTINELPSVTPSIPDVENDFNLGYNCGYADAMIDIAESEDKE